MATLILVGPDDCGHVSCPLVIKFREHRPPRIDQAYDLLKVEIGEFAARSLAAHNPQAIIESLDDVMEITLESPTCKWYQRPWW